MISEEEQVVAKELYGRWFSMYPGIQNPTDPNRKEKYDFMIEIGWDSYRIMQKARKCNSGERFEWTKKEYWECRKS